MCSKRLPSGTINEDNYLTLSATDESSIEAYYSALDFALTNDSIENIGIIGPHASGKTSILRSYNKRCKEQKFAKKHKCRIFKEDYVYITLGDYVRHMSDSNDDEMLEPHSTTSMLQYRIIEQLLCYNPPSRAPHSTIPLLEKTFGHNNPIWRFASGLLTMLLIGAILIGLNLFGAADALEDAVSTFGNQPTGTMEVASQESVTTTEQDDTTTTITSRQVPASQSPSDRITKRLRMLCVLVLSGVAAWQALRLYHAGITIKGLTIGGNSINMENRDRLFDTQIDNLLYLLRRTKRHVMVFEDVDRVDNHYEILTNLRELCFELNVVERTHRNKLLAHIPCFKARPYKFVYCLEQEGIPNTEERTKFFDFILEMVPYGDYTNFGGLLHSKLNEIYHIDRTLLDQAGRTMSNTRECEHLINAFILRQKVLAENNRFVSASQAPSGFNSMVFALVAYKCMYPGDYTLLCRGEGFLLEALQEHSKEEVLEGISTDVREDKMRPYGSLAKEYGNVSRWDENLTDMLECLPYAPTNARVREFVKFALEQGYINERYVSYTSLWRGEMCEEDRKFCLYADSRTADENKKAAWWDRIIEDPIGVLNWLDYWSIAENECALNFSLLDQMLDANCRGTLGAEGKRSLMALLEVAAREEQLMFYELYLMRCSAHQLFRLFHFINSQEAVGHPAHSLGSLEFVTPSNSDLYNLMVLSYLRAVSAVEDPITIGDIVPRRDELVISIEGALYLLQASFEPWLETPSRNGHGRNSDSRVVSQDIAREIAEGLSSLGAKLKSLEHSLENAPIVKAIVEHNCYEITPETVEVVLDTLLTKEEKLQFKDKSVLEPLFFIAGNSPNYGAAIRERMQSDLASFVEVAIANVTTRPRLYRDDLETLYAVLDEGIDVPVELLTKLLLAQHGRHLAYGRINNRLFRPHALHFCEPNLDNLEAYLREHSDTLDLESLEFIKDVAGLRSPLFAFRDNPDALEPVFATEEQRAYLAPFIEQAERLMRANGEPEIRIAKVQRLLDA